MTKTFLTESESKIFQDPNILVKIKIKSYSKIFLPLFIAFFDLNQNVFAEMFFYQNQNQNQNQILKSLFIKIKIFFLKPNNLPKCTHQSTSQVHQVWTLELLWRGGCSRPINIQIYSKDQSRGA